MKVRLLAVCGLLSALFLSVPALPAHARAGGGHSFSGGGHSYSGGGHYSGGSHSYGGGHYYGSSGSGPFAEMAEKHPFATFVLVVVIIILLNRFKVEGMDTYKASTIVRGTAVQRLRDMEGSLGALRARDPAFDQAAFLSRVSAAFLKIQEAWSAGDMRPARAFISDGVMERFTLQLAMNKALRIANRMADVRVLDARLAQAESDAHFDTLHVCLRASAVDTDVSLRTGDLVRNFERADDEFVEVWSFLRRPGAKTLQRPGTLEGHCPSCGAPLEIKDSAQCPSCKSWVNCGDYDWVLAEITQSCEWAPRDASREVPGYPELAAQDPALNVQFLEDRASVAFWRWQAAHWDGHAESLRPVAMETFLPAFQSSRMGIQRCYKNAAVGGVEVLACEPAQPLDRVHVLVKWSGEQLLVKDGSTDSEGQVLRHHVFVLSRKHGVRTDPRAGLSSARCASCGASPTDRGAPRCEYCGADFNDGSRQWVLSDVVTRGEWKPPAPPPQARPAAPAPAAAPSPAPAPAPAAAARPADWATLLSPMDGLAILVAAMIADGEIDAREMEFAKAHARKHSIPEDRIEALLDAARRNALEVPRPKTQREAEAFLRCMAAMCLADGKISAGETRTLLALGQRLGFDPKKVQALALQERDLAYQRAKQSLKSPPRA